MPTDNPRRAAAELFGMLVIAGALLAAPFVYVNVQLDKARRPSAERVAAIEHSDCMQLRETFSNELSTASPLDLSGRTTETLRIIVRRSEQLYCRPAIRWASD